MQINSRWFSQWQLCLVLKKHSLTSLIYSLLLRNRNLWFHYILVEKNNAKFRQIFRLNSQVPDKLVRTLVFYVPSLGFPVKTLSVLNRVLVSMKRLQTCLWNSYDDFKKDTSSLFSLFSISTRLAFKWLEKVILGTTLVMVLSGPAMFC